MKEFKLYSESPIAKLYYSHFNELPDEETDEMYAGVRKYNELLNSLLATIGNDHLAQSIRNVANMASEVEQIGAFQLGIKYAAPLAEVLK